MGVVRTVLRDIDAEQLGPTSMHEHILSTFEVWLEDAEHSPSVRGPVDPEAPVTMDLLGLLRRNPFLLRDNLLLDDVDLAIAEVSRFREVGGSCLVDASSIGIRTNLSGVRRVAEETGVHIVQGTSYYLEGCHPPGVGTSSIDDLANDIVREIQEGIEDTGVRAGVIGEVGTMSVSPAEVKVLRASARAQLMTGAAISLHLHPGYRHAEEIINILLDEGVQPNRIIAGHMDENLVDLGPGLAHLDYHRRIASTGVWLQYDTFGAEGYYDGSAAREPLDSERASAVATMVREGHLDQVLLGMDVWLKQSLRRYGGFGYEHLLTAVPVLLRAAGVDDDSITKMLVDNPRGALAFGR